MNSSLSRNGYKIKKLNTDLSVIKEIKKDLTVNPFTFGDFGDKNEKKFSLFMESPNSLYLPRFYGQDKFGSPANNKLKNGSPIDIQFKGSLRKEQLPIVDLYHKAALKNGGGLISLKCGGGKTVLSLYIISLLKVKTIVVVHKDFLMTQWRDRILEFLPNAKIVHCYRNSRDNCLSLFKNHFPGTKINFAYDISEIIDYYNLYTDLMKHWNNLLPNFVFNLSYEKLISNSENEIKNLLNFCNLDWHSKCLNFYDNKKPIKTASDIQARSKFYSSSIDSWKNYKKFLNKYFQKLIN